MGHFRAPRGGGGIFGVFGLFFGKKMPKFRHFLLARSEVSEHTCGARVYTALRAVCEGGLALTKPGRVLRPHLVHTSLISPKQSFFVVEVK